MGNNDTDGLTAILPSGHLEQLSWWLIEKETHHWQCIDFFLFYQAPSSQTFSSVLTLNFDLRAEQEVTVNASPAHLSHQHVHTHIYILEHTYIR